MSDQCDIYGGNCGICMIAAPYPYCCRKECGEHEFCKDCNYNDKPMKNENGNDIWRVKGFNTLVFDQNGLDKLEGYDKNSRYEEGWADGYTMARKRYDVNFFEDGDEVID